MKKLLLCFVMAISQSGFAQVSFSDSTSKLVSSTLTSGVAMGAADMNGDGLDDLIRLNNASDLVIDYQDPAGGNWTRYTYGDLGSGGEWAICVADVDSNGFRDVISGGVYNNIKLLKANASGTAYTSSNLSAPNIFVQGTNFADIDNDGYADIFACHDDGLSSPYKNDGTGNFTYDLGLINASSTIPSDNSGNYGSTWTDYDNDGDLDLYISKCRQGVSNPMDGRRVNLLFQNDGNNNYTDVAQAAGLRPLAQSWASDFADIDNDGDLDVFIVNHDITSQFFINNGDGTFTDITASTGTASDLTAVGLGIQCKFEDFDNDGYNDLLLTGRSGEHRLLMNNGNNTFSALVNPFPTGGNGIQSCAVGDFNNDGSMDVLAGFATGFNSPSSNPDQMFFNSGNANNWVKVDLEGTFSNTDAIGARIEVYSGFTKQIREIRAGESYGIFHSFVAHFGIGTNTNIDSIIVRWPAGTIDKVCSPAINATHSILEGSEAGNMPVVGFTFSNSGVTTTFSDASTDADTWAWDFGDGNTSTQQNPIHTYAAAGTYTVCLIASNLCGADTICLPVSVCNSPTSAWSFVDIDLGVLFTDLSTGGPTSWLWDFGDGATASTPDPAHTYSFPGTYTVCLIVSNSCSSDTSCQSVTVSCPPPGAGFSVSGTELSYAFNDTSTANPTSWFWDFGDGNTSTLQNPSHVYAALGTYTVCLTVSSTCGTDSACQTVIASCTAPTAGYNFQDNELTISFSDLSTGNPTSWMWDFGDGNTSTQQSPANTYLVSGTYTVCLIVSNACGADTFCTDVTANCGAPGAAFSLIWMEPTVGFTDLSSPAPDTWDWDFGDGSTSTLQNPTHTYTADGTYIVCLTVANVCGSSSYCDTILIQYFGIEDFSSAALINIYPNPAQDEVNVALPGWNTTNSIVIRDMSGRIWKELTLPANNGTVRISVADLSAGSYFLEARNGDEVKIGRFVK